MRLIGRPASGEGKASGGLIRSPRNLAIAFAVLLASIIPPLISHRAPVTGDLERQVYDLYATSLADKVGQDPDIRILYYNDQVALDTGRTSPIDRAVLAKAIAAADAAGAKAIGVDFFFAQPTDDEAELIGALAQVSAPTTVIYADPARDGGQFWDPAIAFESAANQDRFWAAIGNPLVQRASPKIGVGSDRVARSWPARTDQAQLPFAAALAGSAPDQWFDYTGSIAYTRLAEKREQSEDTFAGGMFPAYSITSLANPVLAEAIGENLRGKYVLIGLDMFNADRLPTPVTRILGEESLPGVAVHAHMLRQLLDADLRQPVPVWLVLICALVFALAAAVTAQLDRRYATLAIAVASQLAAVAAAPVMLHRLGYDLIEMPAAGWALGWLLAFLGFGYLARERTSQERAFAQGALGKYLPVTVAREILADPAKLSLDGEERELTMLFTDLEGFTRISHSQPPRTTARILNHYLDEMSEIILSYEGTIDKYVGDAIVAFWGAPISSERDTAKAVACALALDQCAERLRAELSQQGEQLGRTRIGLHRGPVIVGNFGGRQRIQYTALGDAMNTAARLEGANKYLASTILVSAAVRDAAPEFPYLPLGRIVLSGVDTPIAVYQPVGEERRGFVAQVASAMERVERSDPAGVEAVHALAATVSADAALQALAQRVGAITGGKAYALGSK